MSRRQRWGASTAAGHIGCAAGPARLSCATTRDRERGDRHLADFVWGSDRAARLAAIRDRLALVSRDDLYACFTQRRDALFELTDALLTAGAVPSLVHLSLAPAHRRGWGSLYAALADGRLDVAALGSLLARHPLAGAPPIYAVACSTWPRCDAEASPERGYYDHPARHSAGQPIVAGWSYQWVAQLSFARDNWTAPLDVQRVHPTAVAEAVAVEQIERLVARLPADGPVPLFVFDAGDDSLTLALGLAETRAAILVRIRGDRCFDADPPPPDPTGRRGAGHRSARHSTRPSRDTARRQSPARPRLTLLRIGNVLSCPLSPAP